MPPSTLELVLRAHPTQKQVETLQEDNRALLEVLAQNGSLFSMPSRLCDIKEFEADIMIRNTETAPSTTNCGFSFSNNSTPRHCMRDNALRDPSWRGRHNQRPQMAQIGTDRWRGSHGAYR